MLPLLTLGLCLASFSPDGDGFSSRSARVDAQGGISVGALSARTVSLGRQDALWCAGGRASLEGEAVRVDRGPVVERLVSRGDSVEQTWTFASRPEGSGDFVVRLDVRGPGAPRLVDEGVAFGHARYGTATWVDADGVRWEVRPRLECGALVLRVPAAVVDGSSYPAVLDPILQELPVEPVGPGPSLAQQSRPSVAMTSLTDYAVAWVEEERQLSAVVVRRVASGVEESFIVAMSTRERFPSVVVASDGTQYVIAWFEERAQSRTVWATTLPKSGPGPAAPRRVDTASGLLSDLVAVTLPLTNTGPVEILWARRTSTAFEVMASAWAAQSASTPQRLFSVPATSEELRLAAAVSVDTVALVWTERGANQVLGVHAATYRYVGAARTAPVRHGMLSQANAAASSPAVAYDGTAFIAVWVDERNAATAPDLHAKAFTDVPDAGVPFEIDMPAAGAQLEPGLGRLGPGALAVTWTDDPPTSPPSVWQGKLANAAVTESRPVEAGHLSPQSSPALGCAKGECLVAWADRRFGFDADIWAQWIQAPRASPWPLSDGERWQRGPSIAWNGTQFLVTWSGNGAEKPQISMRPFHPLGSPALGAPAVVRADASGHTALACAGTDCAVAWSSAHGDAYRLYVQRLGASAILKWRDGIGPPDPPGIGTDGKGNFLAQWTELAPDGIQREFAAIYDTELRETFTASAGVPITRPSVAYLPGRWISAWTEGSGAHIHWYKDDGYMATPGSIDLSPRGTASSAAVAAASDGTAFVVWLDTSAGKLMGARVGIDAVLGSPLVLAGAKGTDIAIAADGPRFVVTWLEPVDELRSQLVMAELVVRGGVVERVVSNVGAPGIYLAQAVAASGTGIAGLAYARFSPEASKRSPQVFVRGVRALSVGEPCTSSAQCASGSCAEGRCCEQCEPKTAPGEVELSLSVMPDPRIFGSLGTVRAQIKPVGVAVAEAYLQLSASGLDLREATLNGRQLGRREEGGAVRYGPFALGGSLEVEVQGAFDAPGDGSVTAAVVAPDGAPLSPEVSEPFTVLEEPTRIGCGCSAQGGVLGLALAVLARAIRRRVRPCPPPRA